MERETLARVHALLVRLLEVVRGLPEGKRLAVWWRGGDQLEVYEKEALEASDEAGGALDSRELEWLQLNTAQSRRHASRSDRRPRQRMN